MNAALRCQGASSSSAASVRSLRARAFLAPGIGNLRTAGLRPGHLTSRRIHDCSENSGRVVKCRGLFGLGLPEIAVIAGIAALVFGPSKLPELGKGLGQTIKSFNSAAKEFESELKAASAPDEVKEGKKPEAKNNE